jgi:hypothetical protein
MQQTSTWDCIIAASHIAFPYLRVAGVPPEADQVSGKRNKKTET